MKRFCVAIAFCALVLLSGCSTGDSGRNDWRQELVSIYGSHLVLAQDADGSKFAWHRWNSIFEEIKEIRKKNQDLRMRAYSINTAGLSDQDKQGVMALRSALDSFDNVALCLLRVYEEQQNTGEYSSAYKDRTKEYQNSYSSYIAQRNKVKEYISPTPKNTSSK